MRHAIRTFLHLFDYLFTDTKVHYVPTGKFQTNCLELRFSEYRQLSREIFHVSVQEIKQSEKIDHSRGHVFKLITSNCRADARKWFLSQRIVNVWQ